MKQKFFISTLLVLVALMGTGNTFSQTISTGIRLGANLSDWNISGVSGTGLRTKSLVNPEAGFFINIKTSGRFAIEPGISYTNAGAIMKYDADETEFNLSYLQVPVLARFNASNRFSLFSGPQVGLLLKATATDVLDEKASVKNLFKKNDFALVTGMQYNFPAGISIGVKYTAGLSAIYSTADEKIKNYSFGLSAAYQFQLSKRK